MRTERRRRQGVSFPEVIIALVMLAIGMAGSATLVVQAVKISDMARDRYVASHICKNRLEKARAYDVAALDLLAEKNVVVDENGNPDPYGKFARSTVITNTALGATLADILVTTCIRDRKTKRFGVERETIHSLLTDYVEIVE